MNYAYQLLVPLFFCWFFKSIGINHMRILAIVLLVLFNLIQWEVQVLNLVMLEQRNSIEWAELYKYVKASSNILNSPLIASELVELGQPSVDSGQTQYYYSVKPYPDFYLIGPSYSDWQADGRIYTQMLDRSIKEQNFDLVITTGHNAMFFHVKRLPEYYLVVDELTLDMPQTGQSWTVLLWMPLVK